MPFSPPAGNAANFNFTTAGYAPPAGNVANFDFGVDAGGGEVGAGGGAAGRRKLILGS